MVADSAGVRMDVDVIVVPGMAMGVGMDAHGDHAADNVDAEADQELERDRDALGVLKIDGDHCPGGGEQRQRMPHAPGEADTHRLADRARARRQRRDLADDLYLAADAVRRPAELGNAPARHLADQVVERRLEEARPAPGEHVGNVGRRIADGDLGGDVGERIAGRPAVKKSPVGVSPDESADVRSRIRPIRQIGLTAAP